MNFIAFHKKTGFSSALLLSVFLTSFILIVSSNISAQDEKIPKGVVPPPLSVLSKGEKKSLNAKTKPSDRTKLSVILMDARLLKATEFAEKDEFQKSLNQLGHFHAILRDNLKYLKQRGNSRRSLKNFKRFEMSLRKFIPRLELIRRKTPFKYAYHVRTLIKNVRRARSEAIKSFYGDTVVPQGNN